LRLVRQEYPQMLLCLATNGLNILPYVTTLAALNVSHVTLTINAVKPEVGARIYSWMEGNNKTHLSGLDAAKFLWEKQRFAIMLLRSFGITVKINTILIPGINDSHILEVTNTVAKLGANLQNIMSLLPTEKTPFFALPEPDAAQMAHIRAQAEKILPQMSHCMRCRADAAGLLGASLDTKQLHEMQERSVAFTSERCGISQGCAAGAF
jgi:nitrogen fixation protein NifB